MPNTYQVFASYPATAGTVGPIRYLEDGAQGGAVRVLLSGPSFTVRVQISNATFTPNAAPPDSSFETVATVTEPDQPLTFAGPARYVRLVVDSGQVDGGNVSDIRERLASGSSVTDWGGGDHTTLPENSGYYRILSGTEAGQVWQKTGGATTRQPALESVSPRALTQQVFGPNTTEANYSAIQGLLSDDHLPRYALAQKLLELGYSRSAPTFAQFKTAIEAAATTAVATNMVLNVHALQLNLDTTLNLPSGLIVEFAPGFKLTRTSQVAMVLCDASAVGGTAALVATDIPGNLGPRFTANSPSNTQQIRLAAGGVAALGVAVGDWVAVYSSTTYSTGSGSGDGKYMNVRQIRNIVGDYLESWALERTFTVAAGASVRKITFAPGLTIRGGEFTDSPAVLGGTYGSGTTALFRFSYVDGVLIEGAHIHDSVSTAVQFLNCINSVVRSCNIHDLDPNLGYGLNLSGACLNCSVQGGNFARVRHAITTGFGQTSDALNGYGEPEQCGINRATITDNLNAAIDTHEPGYGFFATNNTIIGGRAGGIYIRSTGALISGNVVMNCVTSGIQLAVEASACFVVGNFVSNTARDSTGSAGGYGIVASSNYHRITGNYCRNNDNYQIWVAGQKNFVSDNTLFSWGGLTVTGSNNIMFDNYAQFCSTAYSDGSGATGSIWQGNKHTDVTTPWNLVAATRTSKGNQGHPDYEAGVAQVLTAASAVATTTNLANISAAGNITLTSAPQITGGIDGQPLDIINTSAFTITFTAQSSLAGSKLRLGAATRTLSQGGTLRLIYNAALALWTEVAFNASTV